MEVECIGKGKLHKPYEFGNKVSVAVSGRGNFVLCAKSFHGNPYDVHTLLQTIESVEKLRSAEKKMIKRRSAIEPIIGHLKNFGRMAKNYLKGVIGDILNPLISAIGLNLRNLANNLTYKTKSIFL
jgi:IS5 family transposase